MHKAVEHLFYKMSDIFLWKRPSKQQSWLQIPEIYNNNWEEEKISFWKITECEKSLESKGTASRFGQQPMRRACAVRIIGESEMDAILENSKRKSEMI